MNHMHFKDKKQSRSFFWLIWMIYTIVYMSKSCFTAGMASIVFEGYMTKSQTGLITALFYIIYTPLQIVGGYAADKYDPEKLISFGLASGGMANLILFFIRDYYVILIVWCINAVAQFGIWPSIFKITCSQLALGEKRNAMFYLSFNTAIALMLVYFISAILPKWYYSLLVTSLLMFLSAIVLNVANKKAKPYTVPDDEEREKVPVEGKEEFIKISTNRLFFESAFYILLIVTLFSIIVLNSLKTLSATMFMESYDDVSPAIGNYTNVVVIAVGAFGTIFVKKLLYPKHIKSAPVGISIMVFISLMCSVVLTSLGKIKLLVIVIFMCISVCSLTAARLFTNYCIMRFEKFGKSGMASGVLNMASSFGVFVSSYGVTKVAESFSWQAVTKFFLIMLAVSFGLSLLVIPIWKRFKKKYHSDSIQMLGSAIK